MLVQLYAPRVSADVRIRWSAASLAPNHWSASLTLPEGFAFAIRHKASGARVYHGTYANTEGPSPTGPSLAPAAMTEPVRNADAQVGNRLSVTAAAAVTALGLPVSRALAESVVLGAGALFIGEAYTVEVSRGAGVLPAEVTFTHATHLTTVVDVVLCRATAGLVVRLRSASSMALHWKDAVGLSLHFQVLHAASGGKQLVASGHTDHQGQCKVPSQEALFVGEVYELHVERSSMTEGGSRDFVLTDPQGSSGEEGLCVVELAVQRTVVAVQVRLQCSTVGPGHWSHQQLAVPAFVPLRVIHTATRRFVCEVPTDGRGVAIVEEMYGLCVNETYTIEVPETKFVRHLRVDFKVEHPLHGATEVNIPKCPS